MTQARSPAERGVSFSWRRAIGWSQMSAKISRKTGVPLSRSGRQQKLGRIGLKVILALALLVILLGGALLFGRPEVIETLIGAAQPR